MVIANNSYVHLCRQLGLHAAHLRAFLTAAGVEPWEYACYHGGVAALAGLSCHVHACEFEFLRDPTCASGELTPGKELFAEWPKQWRAMTVAERRAHFAQRAEAPPEHMRALLPLSVFTARCNEPVTPATLTPASSVAPATTTDSSDSDLSGGAHSLSPPFQPPLALYVGSPMTALHATFTHDSALRDRVTYCCAMSGAWEGSKNLLGCCFNNAVDYDASKVVCQPNYFPNGRLLLVPTETCKTGPFTLTPETLAAMSAPPSSPSSPSSASQVTEAPVHKHASNLQASLVASVQQWTDLKRGDAQPLFDVLTVWDLADLMQHTAMVPTEVQFGRNVHALGTLYENLGVTLRNTDLTMQSSSDAAQPEELNPVPASLSDVPGRIGSDSAFSPGRIYATERVFSDGCAAAFAHIFEDMMVDSSSNE